MNKNLFFSYMEHIRGTAPKLLWHLLDPLGYLGALYSSCRNGFYNVGLLPTLETPLPVISVGNLTLGGTNKTPFVSMIARSLMEAGLHPGIVSRGYGGSVQQTRILMGGRGRRELVGDEPLLLSHALPEVPVAVSPHRYEGVLALAKEGCTVVVADDAFQHRTMGRDVDILLVDATCPFGNRKHVPAGILREKIEGTRRAHMVVITKADQVSPDHLALLKKELENYAKGENIFVSRLVRRKWDCLYNNSRTSSTFPQGVFLVFSAIGNPRSFVQLLEREGMEVRKEVHFRDHHRFSPEDMAFLEEECVALGCQGLICTEKDLWNLPEKYAPPLPLFVPAVETLVEDSHKFWKTLTNFLQPRMVVASNGYGEDAVGVALAERLQGRFPQADVGAFALVGRGLAYENKNISVLSPPVESSSGGIIKYSLRVLLKEIREGLLGKICHQISFWKPLQGRVRTVLCVGDVYLLLHTLLGQGQRPTLLATAKSVLLGGHWRVERFLLRRFCRIVWTRDGETAQELQRAGVKALFRGNPLMDICLLSGQEPSPLWDNTKEHKILLLPGSRQRAYQDLSLLLDTVLRLWREKASLAFLLVVAPTLDMKELEGKALEKGWDVEPHGWAHPQGGFVSIYSGSVANAAQDADLLMGFGGTANQICAGLGVPVLSVEEKGKKVQKKLLGEAEVLVPSRKEELGNKALELLRNPEKLRHMGEAGRQAMGPSGSLKRIVEDLDSTFGWSNRCSVYEELRKCQEGADIQEKESKPCLLSQ